MSSNDTLLIYSGETLAREVPLTRSEAVIGRSAECDIVLEPASVSRRHVRLVRRGDTWLAENLSTSAPAQLNGVALTAPAALRPGDRLAVGPFMIALRLAPPPPPAATVITPQAPTLTVSYGGTSAEHILTGASVTIGRSPENSIVIPLGTVSRRHALLQQTPHGYTIIDQNSANGLLRNGAPVAQHPLADGDIIRIGDELGNFVTLAYRTSAAAPAPPIAELKLNAEQQEVTIGRAPGNTLVLDYPDVSARHARLRWQAGSVVLEDLGSTNGTFVRGERIRARAVHPGDLIQIAGRQIVYQADTIRPVEADAVRLDAIQLSTTAARGKITLLHNVSLSIMPRQLVALVGGSGTGKSTLMGALCGIRPASSGQVLVNGVDLYRTYGAYRRSIGYVPQDDIIHTDLPVDRTLHYAARLRLPADTSPDEIERRVGEVLDDVQLGHVRRVEVSRLSGGQRKRVSVAVELLARPQLFFLDEPTTGLDPGLDKRMMTLLRQFADQGRTVVLVTHATANIETCDRVAFLARGGRLCFFGPPHEALHFFGATSFAEIYARLDQTPESGAQWAERFAQSPQHQQYVAQPLAGATPATPQPPQAAARAPRAGGWRQLRILTARALERSRRSRSGLIAALAPALVISVLLAIFSNSDVFAAGASPLDAQRLLFLLVIAAVLLGANSAAREIVKERAIYARERLVNLRLLPYLGSKIGALGLTSLAQAVLLLSVVLMRAGLPPAGALLPALPELVIGLWLAGIGGVALGLLLSAFAATVEQAVSLLPVVLLAQILLSGLVFPLPDLIRPVSAITVARWGTESLGTSADLNRLFFLSRPSGPPGIRPLNLPPPAGFEPERYDTAGPREAYTPEAFRASRRTTLLGRWAALIALTGGTLALAGAALRRQDQR